MQSAVVQHGSSAVWQCKQMACCHIRRQAAHEVISDGDRAAWLHDAVQFAQGLQSAIAHLQVDATSHDSL